MMDLNAEWGGLMINKALVYFVMQYLNKQGCAAYKRCLIYGPHVPEINVNLVLF